MKSNLPQKQEHSSQEEISSYVFGRVANAPLISGNSVKLLHDATENYPAWLDAVQRAEKRINFESYIIHDDAQGRLFGDALIAKVREGVKVRLIYDWVGGFNTPSSFWRYLREGGVEVRCFNPFSFKSPLGWIHRDHRKSLIVDGKIAFVSGLCVGQMWVGEPEKGKAPWRDTGVEIRGKSVAEVEEAFARVWATMGEPIPENEIVTEAELNDEGDFALRVVAGMTNMTGLYRLDQIIAATAQKNLWLTDAYFAGTTSYVQALRDAARDGVDVRLLVPASTDIPIVQAISRAGYRPLLDAGVKIYEWNGPMIHAKTAVADGRWARVGSTNLNIASWMGNWELDVIVEDERFGREMEEMFLEDIANSTSITLDARNRPQKTSNAGQKTRIPQDKQELKGSASKVAAGALSVGSSIGASLTNSRPLGAAESRMMLVGAGLLFVLSLIALIFPYILTIPLGVVGLWIAASLALRSRRLPQEDRPSINSLEHWQNDTRRRLRDVD